MTREERQRLLGDDVIAQIHARVAEAPAPTADVIADLRRILTRPAGRSAVAAAPVQRAA
ncbi:hypothetical protein ACIRQP_14725 [Streptomyces sp. NPDC102274]|uniref:hypothetical protein n=1 Tax=Streptomyces sp. NPDC102274 TaxID=3366151 RepID=UPI0038021EA1